MQFEIGQRVTHDILGPGEIIDIYEHTDNKWYIDIHLDSDVKKYKVHTFTEETLLPHIVKE